VTPDEFCLVHRPLIRGCTELTHSLAREVVWMKLPFTEVHSKYVEFMFLCKNAQSFLTCVEGLRDALETCEKAIYKLTEGNEGHLSPANLLCRIYSQYLHVFSTSLASVPIEELRSMKRAFKEKVGTYESEFKKKVKDFDSLKQSLEKAEESFARTESDIKKAHSRTTDPFVRKSPFSWSQSTGDRDKNFERMQKLTLDREKIVSECQQLLNELTSAHSSAYSRAGIVQTEVSSMRRRINRRIDSETRQILGKIDKCLSQLPDLAIAPLLDQLKRICPSAGDFGTKLAPPEISLTQLVGSDHENRIKMMQTRPDMIEYRAVQSYMAKEAGELSFSRNELIEVLRKDPSGWWQGKNSLGHIGVFPSVLLAERPAGAALPLQQIQLNTYKPNLLQRRPSGTWNTMDGSMRDSRERLIMAQPPYSLIAVVQFKYVGETIAVSPGEVVKIGGPTDTNGYVQVKNSAGQQGLVPLNILSIKHQEKDNSKYTSVHSYQNELPSSLSFQW
jgi:hypothetical protein